MPMVEIVAQLAPQRSTQYEGGALAFSWDATRFPRSEMSAFVEASSDFTVLKDSPYNQLGHRVDRVIKRRDVIVARKG